MQLVAVLVSTSIVLVSASASASSPAFPICDAEPASGSLITESVPLAPTCAVRWVDDEVRPGGLRFDLQGPDRIAKASVVITTPSPLAVPETRHECDGRITTTTRTLQEYAVAFDDAQPGDSVAVLDASGNFLALQELAGSTCTPVDLAPLECQVCGPPSGNFGCGDAGHGRGLATLALVGLGLVLARRRR